ncbi:MAG: indolepyruvate oxidoreductase subunit beta [Eubacteriaceae bacterium]|nr:indolepyruvate oxidoreductase subunit beta [Eubacteriaceae bacterium]MBR5995962.1 indolepyruvate oxidoreductase subunit beta [Eubacteriaceae bacterium]
MATTGILLCGVGGQGTVTFSNILTKGLMDLGYDVKMSEIHGMAQRGGAVTTQVRYGEKVYSPSLGFGQADIIISFEKCEAVRNIAYLREGGIVITDTCELNGLPILQGTAEYPHGILDELEKTVPNVMVVEANKVAADLGNVVVANIVLLGAMVKAMHLEAADWTGIIESSVPPKTIDLNKAAFNAGYAM